MNVQLFDLLKEVIQKQSSLIYYGGLERTHMLRRCIYKSFLNLLDQNPQPMINYLLFSSHKGGMQAKLFQETVRLLEEKIPYTYREKRVNYCVSSLLDRGLNLFDGISSFETKVSKSKVISNRTNELYIGGRKSSIVRPFYIGRLLEVIDVEKDASIIADVSSYSFSRIQLMKTKPETTVKVIHLRSIPHYQAGGMAHLNRIRKRIVKEAQSEVKRLSDGMTNECILKVG